MRRSISSNRRAYAALFDGLAKQIAGCATCGRSTLFRTWTNMAKKGWQVLSYAGGVLTWACRDCLHAEARHAIHALDCRPGVFTPRPPGWTELVLAHAQGVRGVLFAEAAS